MIRAYRKVTIPTPGTPVRVTSIETNPDGPKPCHGVLIQALKSNVGVVYVGNSAMDKTALTGLFAQLAIPTSNSIPSYSAALTIAPAGIQLKDLWIDADSANDGVIISILDI